MGYCGANTQLATSKAMPNIDVLQKGLARIDSKGGTAMRDAIRVSIDYLHDKAKIYEHLRDRQRSLVSQWKQDVRTRDRLVAGQSPPTASKSTREIE